MAMYTGKELGEMSKAGLLTRSHYGACSACGLYVIHRYGNLKRHRAACNKAKRAERVKADAEYAARKAAEAAE